MPHAKLTPADIRDAFHTAIPRRRDDFRETVAELKRQHTKNDTVLSRYINDVARLAKQELRARFDAATRLVERLIDDGWEPTTAETIDGIYQSLFSGYGSAEFDPITDLQNAVAVVYGDLGGNTADIRGSFDRAFQDAQVHAFKEAIAALKLHRPGKTHAVFSAPVNLVQIGDGNSGTVVAERGDATA